MGEWNMGPLFIGAIFFFLTLAFSFLGAFYYYYYFCFDTLKFWANSIFEVSSHSVCEGLVSDSLRFRTL